MGIALSKFIDLRDGLREGQFSVGERTTLDSLSDLDPIYQQLMDQPITGVVAVMGGDGRPNLTPMWFDYEGDKVLLNVAEHRKKTEWIRANPQVSIILVNPENPYHWMSLKVTVDREIAEDDPVEGIWVTEQVNRIWDKYMNEEGGTYSLRDPAKDEKRILFECSVDRIATFGVPA